MLLKIAWCLIGEMDGAMISIVIFETDEQTKNFELHPMKKNILLFLVATNFAFPEVVQFVFTDLGTEVGAFDHPLQTEDFNAPSHLQLQYYLKQKGYDIKGCSGGCFDFGDVVIFNNLGRRYILKAAAFLRSKKILVIWEPPTVMPHQYNPLFLALFDRVITWDDRLAQKNGYIKFNYPVNRGVLLDIPGFHGRKLVCTIIGNKTSSHPDELYSARREIVSFYEKNLQLPFDLYGVGWEKSGLKRYCGSPPDKIAVLKEYRFAFSYENYRNDRGYITEKIFDCFYAGTVPIYLGASNITNYIPEGCFIDARKFSSHQELHRYLETMDEKTWLTFRKCAEEFCRSSKGDLFREKQLVDAYLKAIFE